MTIKALYPTVRPTLNLDFAKTKALDPRITFTRASTATYVGADGLIKTAASGAARFDHNPTTGESLGLLVEEARTNYNLYSEQFDNAWWIPFNVSLVPNTIIAPTGSLTGDKLIENTATTQHYNLGNSTTPGPATFTSSVFVKAGERTAYQMLMSDFATGGPTLKVNLSTGTIISLGTTGQWSNSSASVINFGNGWYRVSLTSTLSNSASPRIAHHLLNASNADTYTGDGVSGIYLWGAQVEAGSFPTSYIPTTTATVTRAADVASMTGTNFSSWYNQSEGTLLAAARLGFSLSTSAVFPNIYQMGGYPDRLWMLYLNGTVNQLTIGADTHTRNFGTFSSSPQSFKVAQALSNTSLTYGVSKDGATALTGSLSKAVTNLSGIDIGSGVGATKHIARLAYYPVRLPDAQLQALTAT